MQILDYKYVEVEDDCPDSDDDEKKYLKCYILMEEIKGISLRDLYEYKFKKATSKEEQEERVKIMWKVF